MRTDFTQTSQFYFAIANLLSHLEKHAPGTYDVAKIEGWCTRGQP